MNQPLTEAERKGERENAIQLFFDGMFYRDEARKYFIRFGGTAEQFDADLKRALKERRK